MYSVRAEGVSPLERCPHFREWYVQGLMELRPEDVSLLERCPHYIQGSYQSRDGYKATFHPATPCRGAGVIPQKFYLGNLTILRFACCCEV